MWSNHPALDLNAYPAWLLPREGPANGDPIQHPVRREIYRVNSNGHRPASIAGSGLSGLYRGHFGNGAGHGDRVSISGLSI